VSAVARRWLDSWRARKHWWFRLSLTLVAGALLLWRIYGGGPNAAFFVSMSLILAMSVYIPGDLRQDGERRKARHAERG
jgi:hypothetical protein